jgi:peptidoglycan hydrolase-like protein with peptidoglycan-binding domain
MFWRGDGLAPCSTTRTGAFLPTQIEETSMKPRNLLLTTALVAFAASGPAFAQDQSGDQATQQQAQSGQQGADQRLTQEAARYQGTEIYISTAGTRQIQQVLNQAGYDAGNIDGQWNEQTSAAAANFQQAQGLEPTGTLTVSTIRALGLENVLSGGQSGGQQASGQSGGQQSGDQQLAQEEAQGQGTMLYVSPASVRQIKQALNDQSYSAGDVSGQWGEEAMQAARNFQQAQGMEPTGVIDLGLIAALGVGQQVFSGGQQDADQQLTQEAANSEGAPLYLGPAGVRQVTQALNQAGYQAGNVNAQWGEETKQAVLNYQQAQGLEPTGTLTTAFLSSVGMGEWLQNVFSGGGGGQQNAVSATQQSGGTDAQATGSVNQQSGGSQDNVTVETVPVE